MRCVGFEPFINPDSELLILGSFPSVKSRAQNFYYGNPQNRFWKVLAEAFDEAEPTSVEVKKTFLKNRKIALWDVVSECEIEGSLDSNIKAYSVANVSVLLESSKIKTVLLNGKTAAKIFLKNFPQYGNIAICLPSTSPANARLNRAVWIDALAAAFNSADK